MSMLQMSISAAVMIFIITVIRALAINRLPKKTFIVLWGIVLLRLLVPFSLPSPISVYSFANRQATIQISGTPIAYVLPGVQTAALPAAAPDAGISLWAWIWGIGSGICILYFAASYIRCRREFRTSQTVGNEFTAAWLAEHNCRRHVTIRQTGGITAPLTYGIFRPVILMPALTDWTDTEKLNYVLAHEYVHIRRFDGVTKLLFTAALCIHWFNPLVWVMYILANRDLELSCDEKVVRIFGETVKSAYALTLINMAEKSSGLTPLCNHFSKNAIEERIEAIMKIKKTTAFTFVIACTVVGVLGSTLATSAAAGSTSKVPSYIKEDTAVKEDISVSDNGSYAYKFLPAPELYEKYSAYGINISEDGKVLLYNGEKVKLFVDEYADAQAFYYDEEGTMSLAVERNTLGEITGVYTISEEDAQQYRKVFFEGDINSETHTDGTKWEQYLPYGISFSEEENILYYNGQKVRLFVDEKAGIFDTLWNDEDGTVDLSVVRDASGQITRLDTISKEKVQEYFDEAARYEQEVLERVKKLYPDD